MTRAVNTALAGSGGVLQVVQATKTDTFTTTSTSFTGVTGLSVSITPTSTSNKVLIVGYYFLSNSNTSANYHSLSRLVRDSTAIFVGDAAGSRSRGLSFSFLPNSTAGQATGFSYVDSPATVSSTTYSIQIATESGGTATIGRVGADSDSAVFLRMPASIIVMEIAG
jgi:hypothetical protein